MIKIINFAGKAEHGKDTFARMLKEKLELQNKKVLILHFADYLKYICSQYFGWNGKKDKQGRGILQSVGTDKIRNIYPDFWVEIIYNLINVFHNDFDYFLMPDFRFRNESEYFKERGMPLITVYITRYNYKNSLSDEQKNHPSEKNLDDYTFDYYVYVDEGLDKLEKEVDIFINNYNLLEVTN